MPLREAEAFILRTWPMRESDKIVSFFTREFGKCRGVARGARRPKSKFGAMLEPLSETRLRFFEREGRELSSIDNGELLHSMAAAGGASLLAALALGCVAETAERMLPEREANPVVYRLLGVVLEALRGAPPGEAGTWLALTFYLYWMVRLGGFLPELAALPAEARALGGAVATHHLADLMGRPRAEGPGETPADPPICAALAAGLAGRELRAFLRRQIERHLEARLHCWPLLAGLESGAEA